MVHGCLPRVYPRPCESTPKDEQCSLSRVPGGDAIRLQDVEPARRCGVMGGWGSPEQTRGLAGVGDFYIPIREGLDGF